MTARVRATRFAAAAMVLAAILIPPAEVSLADEPAPSAALEKEQAELQRRVVQALQKGDRVALYVAMDEYRALEKAGANVPAGLYFAEAEAARSQRDPVRAERAYQDFFRVAQREGEVFNEALHTYAEWQNSIPASGWVILEGMVPVPGAASPDSRARGATGGGNTPLRPYSIGRNEVTRAQFHAFLAATGYRPKDNAPSDFATSATDADELTCSMSTQDWTQAGYEQTDSDPVVCVSWEDARAYIEWLNQSTGLQFRLPTGREWDYAASGGASTRYWFGDVHDPSMGNGPGTGGTDRWSTGTAPVGQFPANPFGMMDMVGNVAEWVAACPEAAPSAANTQDAECTLPAVRGGSWRSETAEPSSTGPRSASPTSREPDLGFRLAMGS